MTAAARVLELQLNGVGLLRANEALNALSRIQKDDPFRERGLQMVADWIEHNGNAPRPTTITTSMAPGSVATLSRGAICAREGCGKPLPARSVARGSPMRFCSARCRWLAWNAAHPRKATP